jgi:hypothetical protein
MMLQATATMEEMADTRKDCCLNAERRLLADQKITTGDLASLPPRPPSGRVIPVEHSIAQSSFLHKNPGLTVGVFSCLREESLGKGAGIIKQKQVSYNMI